MRHRLIALSGRLIGHRDRVMDRRAAIVDRQRLPQCFDGASVLAGLSRGITDEKQALYVIWFTRQNAGAKLLGLAQLAHVMMFERRREQRVDIGAG